MTAEKRCCGCADDEAHKYAECFCRCHTLHDQMNAEAEVRYRRIMNDWMVGRLAPK